MNDLHKRFEEETGNQVYDTPIGVLKHNYDYVKWLENQLIWRSVEDGLPEKQGDFFVRTPNSFPKNIPYQVAEFYDDNNTFYNEYDSPLEDVTHWLPIPKLD